jgi:hypothetical protein
MEFNEKRFEDYFAGLLSEDEIQQFNNELATNKVFNDEFQYFLALKESTSSIERDNLRAQLNDITFEPDSNNNTEVKSSSLKGKLIKWALILLSLSMLIYFSYNYFTSDKLEAVYASNFELYEAQSSRGENANAIIQLYKDGKYAEFIAEADEDNNSAEIYMMLANAHIKENNFKMAEMYLLKISDESSLRDLKYWNLGLVSLKINHIPQAKNHFVHLQSVSNFKKAKIEKILSKLNN